MFDVQHKRCSFALTTSDGFQETCDGTVGDIPTEWQNKTSVMVRNIPYKCTPTMFEHELNKAGFEDLFDYVYVPVNPGRTTTKGYAFVNFVDARTAYRFKQQFESTMMNGSKKQLEVIPSHMQGFTSNSLHCCKNKYVQGSFDPDPLQQKPLRVEEVATGHFANHIQQYISGPTVLASKETIRQADLAEPGNFAHAQPQALFSRVENFESVRYEGPQCIASMQETSATLFCQMCHVFLEPEGKFCWSCGRRLNGSEPVNVRARVA
eukprot:TRINITY_DN3219_c0_g2_i1.p1 TRINITY_DN3219_c0_g2~~TRINITY_DN3219_c0_g2_i1.p1  ORF type:complete len:265 (-),score=25.31 TRINITY_DN3219_c0_g2_i1:291-1085(-)